MKLTTAQKQRLEEAGFTHPLLIDEPDAESVFSLHVVKNNVRCSLAHDRNKSPKLKSLKAHIERCIERLCEALK